MANVIDNDGYELNAEVNVLEIDNHVGLVFESRGGRNRNSDYNTALEIILSRLQNAYIETINIVIISSDLLSYFHDPTYRTINIEDSTNIKLRSHNTKELRIKIGKAQTKIKIDSSTTGGSPVKRIQLISDQLSNSDWEILISRNLTDEDRRLLPKFDTAEFEKKVEEYLKNSNALDNIPMGNDNPSKRILNRTEVVERDPAVKAWIIRESNGFCENCGKPSPFEKENGDFYIEVHHVKLLTEKGADTIYNAIAVCSNCHRELHYGKDKKKLISILYANIKRLKK